MTNYERQLRYRLRCKLRKAGVELPDWLKPIIPTGRARTSTTPGALRQRAYWARRRKAEIARPNPPKQPTKETA